MTQVCVDTCQLSKPRISNVLKFKLNLGEQIENNAQPPQALNFNVDLS